MIHPWDWLKLTRWLIRQEIVWDRTLAAQLRGWRFWQTDERIYWLYKPDGSRVGEELKAVYAKWGSVWRGMPESGIDHPAPFPCGFRRGLLRLCWMSLV